MKTKRKSKSGDQSQVSILTKKVKHSVDFSGELACAIQVAQFAIANRDKLTSKYVKHIGLKSAFSNQILRKYGRNTSCKEISSVNLVVPGQAIRVSEDRKIATIIPLRQTIDLSYFPQFIKIRQIEISDSYYFVSFSVEEKPERAVSYYFGVDLNSTGHIAVAADVSNGRVLKMGKLALHFHRKYNGRDKCGRFMRDLDHKISRRLVNYAIEHSCGIALEDLTGIRKGRNKNKGKRLNKILHSWSFRRLQTFIVYKAKLAGVPVRFVKPCYTSQECSRCGCIGRRTKKSFTCDCGHVDHADANAAFNVGRLATDRDVVKRGTDTPPLEPHML